MHAARKRNMENHLHKITKYTALILISYVSMSLDVFAETQTNQVAQVIHGVVKTASETRLKVLADKERKIDDEAEQVLSETKSALHALANNDGKKALAILQGTLSKLDIILANNLAQALVPADVEVDILDF